MREILFRGKSVSDGEWVEGYLVAKYDVDATSFSKVEIIRKNDYTISADYDTCFHHLEPVIVDENTVGQYTGLKDKNGKRIFELDIVLGRFEFGMEVPSLVVFRDGAFGLEWKHAEKTVFTSFTGFCNVTLEVVGNVFDNPEGYNGDDDSKRIVLQEETVKTK